MKYLHIFSCIILFFAIPSLNAKDIVITEDGNIYRGKIISLDKDKLQVEINENNILTFKIDKVQKIDFERTSKIVEKSEVEFENYFDFGLLFSAPERLNFSGAYHWKYFSIGSSIGMSEFSYAFEIYPQVTIRFTDKFFLAFILPIGIENYSFNYYDFDTGESNFSVTNLYSGLAIGLNIYGVVLSVGLKKNSFTGELPNYRSLNSAYGRLGYKYPFFN